MWCHFCTPSLEWCCDSGTNFHTKLFLINAGDFPDVKCRHTITPVPMDLLESCFVWKIIGRVWQLITRLADVASKPSCRKVKGSFTLTNFNFPYNGLFSRCHAFVWHFDLYIFFYNYFIFNCYYYYHYYFIMFLLSVDCVTRENWPFS